MSYPRFSSSGKNTTPLLANTGKILPTIEIAEGKEIEVRFPGLMFLMTEESGKKPIPTEKNAGFLAIFFL